MTPGQIWVWENEDGDVALQITKINEDNEATCIVLSSTDLDYKAGEEDWFSENFFQNDVTLVDDRIGTIWRWVRHDMEFRLDRFEEDSGIGTVTDAGTSAIHRLGDRARFSEDRFEDGGDGVILQVPEPSEHSAGNACLRDVLDCAFRQVTEGKGDERHGHGRDFIEHPWVSLRALYGENCLFGQAAKKMAEALNKEGEEFEREVLGAIVYAAMAIVGRRML